MIKYKEYEVDITKTNYSDGVAILPLTNGSIVCLPEDCATTEELEIIKQIKNDLEKRPSITITLTDDELKAKYDLLSVQYIHEKYNYDDENKIMREYLSDMSNEVNKKSFDEYNLYVKECKDKAYKEIYSK